MTAPEEDAKTKRGTDANGRISALLTGGIITEGKTQKKKREIHQSDTRSQKGEAQGRASAGKNNSKHGPRIYGGKQ